MSEERLERQLRFLLELDALKRVERRSWLLGGARRENSAEHSWHVALFGWLLAEHADEPLDRERVLRLLLVHDVVEIDAGDTFRYDADGHADKPGRERAAAERLFGMLPADQGGELRRLWEEFEARETPEARFAAAVDRLSPLLLNHHTEGRTWREHGVGADRVTTANASIGEASRRLWRHARELIEASVRRGHLEPAPVEREEAGARRESVWAYPRPPRLEKVRERVRVEFAGETVAESRRALRVCETASPPCYYVPRDDVRMDLLEPSARRSLCEWKGQARYFSLRVGGRSACDAAWSYERPDPAFAELAGHLAFFAGRVDACYVGEQRVTPQPGSFYGGWITPELAGPFKGGPGTEGW